MKVRQFPYAGNNNNRMKEDEESLNEFLENIRFIDAQYAGVSGENIEGIPYVTGMVLVQYEDGMPNPGEVVQMKQFPLGTSSSGSIGEDQRTLNLFLDSVDVKDMKYEGVSGKNILGADFVTGLVLVVYKSTKE